MPASDFPFDEIACWRVEPGATGAEQMALDETMLRLADRPTLRVYRWIDAEITFGYPQRWTEARAFAAGRPVTRRCTGGGFVEHGRDVTIALAVPIAHSFARLAPARIYRNIHEALARSLGGGRRLAGAAEGSVGPACFSSPAPGDVIDGARKVAGGALRRSREGVLYQGSVHGDTDFAAALGRRLTEWRPREREWQTRRDELVSTRYGCDAWNRRR